MTVYCNFFFTKQSDIKYWKEQKEKAESLCDEMDEENQEHVAEIKQLKLQLQQSESEYIWINNG